MIDCASKLLIFVKDFTGQGKDRFYWFDGDQLSLTSADLVVKYPGAVVCHDFWLIRDDIFEKTGDLPQNIIDLDEFRMAVSGNPDDRIQRERFDITSLLDKYGASQDNCSKYRKMFYKGMEFDEAVACEAARLRTH
jgi:DNA polymerase-1